LPNLQETRGLGPPQIVSVVFSEEAQHRGPMLVERRHLDGRAAGEREGRDQDVVVEAMQLLALLRCRSVEEHPSTCTTSLLQAAGLPRQAKTSETHAAWPRVQRFLPRERRQELAGLARVVV
jgi:hypothetical protein